MESYYQCKRCLHKCKQKNDMYRHLNKKKICIRILESFQIYKSENDDQLYELSLVQVKKQKTTFCEFCNKYFYNTNNLKRHIDKYCSKKKYNKNENKNNNDLDNNSNNDSDNNSDDNLDDDSDNNDADTNNDLYINKLTNNNNSGNNHKNKPNIIINQNDKNINIINNITDNSVININLINSFNDQWNTTHIDDTKKFILLCNKMKFTSTLEKILENEVNQNVLIDDISGKGIIFNDKKIINMDIKDIVKKTMDKLFNQLCDFKNDIEFTNSLCINTKILEDEIKNAKHKYSEFKNYKNVEESVNEYIKDIYNKKKTNTIDNFSLIKKNGY